MADCKIVWDTSAWKYIYIYIFFPVSPFTALIFIFLFMSVKDWNQSGTTHSEMLELDFENRSSKSWVGSKVKVIDRVQHRIRSYFFLANLTTCSWNTALSNVNLVKGQCHSDHPHPIRPFWDLVLKMQGPGWWWCIKVKVIYGHRENHPLSDDCW